MPSTRFRVCQYQHLLADDGITCKNLYTRPTKYLYYPKLIRNNPLKPVWAAASLSWVITQRLWQIALQARSHQVIFIQRDLLYRVTTPLLERLLISLATSGGHNRIVFDIDDAIFLGKGGSDAPLMKKKVAAIAGRCDTIIAGNRYLSDELNFPEKTVIIPTTIPTDRYEPTSAAGPPRSTPVIGWTGVASNLHYLVKLEDVLNEVWHKHNFELHIVCEANTESPFSNPHFAVKMVPWSPASETQALRSFDVGLMPLSDDRWSRGKCGFKLLQYMAMGLPSIASPVGVNREIIQDAENGMLAGTPQKWGEALDALLSSSDLRKRYGSAGTETVHRHYSRDRWYPDWRRAVLGNTIL